MRTAIIVGSSGLVGSCLLQELLNKPEYISVKSFVRKTSGLSHQKLSEHVIDFENLSASANAFTGDDLFICLGTTIKKAGSVANMERIDRDYPVQVAQISQINGVKQVAVVSSIGSNSKSKNYYLRIKGEMEAEISRLDFHKIAIAKPSMLLGKRNEFRFSEKIASIVMVPLNYLLWGPVRKFRSIQAQTVARAMVKILTQNIPGIVFESDTLQQIGSS